jgi:hypothetical protein
MHKRVSGSNLRSTSASAMRANRSANCEENESSNRLPKTGANPAYNPNQSLPLTSPELGNRCVYRDLVAWRFHERNTQPASR